MTAPLLLSLSEAVLLGDPGALEERLAAARAAGHADPALRSALLAGLDRARAELRTGRMPVAELLLCLDRVGPALASLTPPAQPGARIVLGVVAGDPHDLGKEIVAAVYRAHGFEVIDLGRDVGVHGFVDAIERHRPPLLGLSAMMSTTMSQMRDITAAVRARHPETMVLVGGAPLSPELARGYGADGYAASALDVIEVTRDLLARRATVPAGG